MPDAKIALSPANPIPFKAVDQGDGTFALAVADAGAIGGPDDGVVALDPTNPLPVRAYALGDGTFALAVAAV